MYMKCSIVSPWLVPELTGAQWVEPLPQASYKGCSYVQVLSVYVLTCALYVHI